MHHPSTPSTTIRPAGPRDRDAVLALAVLTEMFAPDEADGLGEVFDSAVTGGLEDHQWFVSTRGTGSEDAVVAAAYVAPEPFSDRLWNLYFIAVHPSEQGSGAGSALLAHVESWLRDKGEEVARVLLVETSSTDQYEDTRAFYARRGFDQEATIREFYGPGDHKVVFWKALAQH